MNMYSKLEIQVKMSRCELKKINFRRGKSRKTS